METGSPDLSELEAMLGERDAAIVSTKGMVERGFVSRVSKACPRSRLKLLASVRPNPTMASIAAAAGELLDSGFVPEALIALGGGSTIDTAKGIAAILSAGSGDPEWLATHLREELPYPESSGTVPSIIAIPTTAGTGSEVTMWGTVWDEGTGAKYSISHRSLFPEWALLVPELTVTAPRETTLFTGLDALSHCMESIWNLRATAISDAFATAGIRMILRGIPEVLQHPADLGARRTMQEAALLGGLAISVTATALAHSISYPLTSLRGMPHGLACSFTLPALMRFNAEAAPERVEVAAAAIGGPDSGSAASRLESLFAEWEVGRHVAGYLDATAAESIRERLLTPGRAENNVRPATHADALGIVLSSLG